MIETVHHLDVLYRITKILLDKIYISLNPVDLRIEVADMPSKFLQEGLDIFQRNTGRMSCNEPRWPGGRHRSYLAYHKLRLHNGKNGRTTLTNRASPASTNGFVVNHSHMKALVDPSLTELINPRMSLFTVLVSVARSILCGAEILTLKF